MDKNTYNKIWNIISYNSKRAIEFMDTDGVFFDKNTKKLIHDEYERLKAELKTKHFPKDENVRMDRHKVASCFAGAILKLEPLKKTEEIDNQTKNNRVYYFKNEFLALSVAMDIVNSFLNEGNRVDYCFPENDKENYLTWLCFSLFDEDVKNHPFNVLMFSNILFLLETYSSINKKFFDTKKQINKC